MGQDINDNSDSTQVAIFFEDPSINFMFAKLLKSIGVSTRIITSAAELGATIKVVTEPQYFSQLNGIARENCLLVGNKDVLKGLNAITLSRPLTEDKIESAFQEFLKT